jgi:dienelactone hydrolase
VLVGLVQVTFGQLARGLSVHVPLYCALRSKALWRALALLAGFELLATSAWLAFCFGRSPGHFELWLAALATPLVGIVGFVYGGRAEQRKAWFTRLAHFYGSRRPYYEPLRVGGDPTLAQRRHALKPSRPFAPLTSPQQMSAWRDTTRREIIAGLYQDAFAAEDEVPRFRVLREANLDGRISRAFVTYETADGTTIPAYLFRPKSDTPLPAVLIVPGSGRGIVETAGLVRSYQNGAALALARAGFVTLTPELRGFGHLGHVVGTDPERVALNALMAGRSYSSIIIHDLRRALTALLGDRAVDPTRVTVSGCSLGGDLAITLGALDTRASAVLAQGLYPWHGDRGQRPTPEEDGSAFSRHSCSIIPGEATLSHYEDRFLLVAPRPFAIINGKRDVGDMREEDSWLPSLLRAEYRLEQADSCFEFVLAPGGHEYHLAPAIDFLHRPLAAGVPRGLRLDCPRSSDPAANRLEWARGFDAG